MTKNETIYQLEAVRDSCRAHGNDFDADVLDHCIDSVKTFREPKAHCSCEQQPLTMAELRKMNGETVYCLELNTEVQIRAPKHGFIYVSYRFPGVHGEHNAMDLTLYRTQTEAGVRFGPTPDGPWQNCTNCGNFESKGWCGSCFRYLDEDGKPYTAPINWKPRGEEHHG